jgi:uncharacterized protein YjbI with pentapeptide repeats
MKVKELIQIKNIFGSVIYEYKCEDNTIKKTVEKAVSESANLRSANLRYADLCSANLCSANLRSADLRYADLCSANLCSANLRSADLRYADLHSADLHSADLRYANLRSADLCSANLHSANLCSADLRYADLCSANLCSADLRSADLCSANLRYADLHSADLCSANLRSAKCDEPFIIADLYSIKMQPKETILHYWKYLNNGKSPIQTDNPIFYEVGKTYTEKKLDKDEFNECGEGLNVATLQWCLQNTIGNNDVDFIEVEFKVKDIIAIPYFTDGKFRVKKLKVLRKLTRQEALDEFKKIAGWDK